MMGLYYIVVLNATLLYFYSTTFHTQHKRLIVDLLYRLSFYTKYMINLQNLMQAYIWSTILIGLLLILDFEDFFL